MNDDKRKKHVETVFKSKFEVLMCTFAFFMNFMHKYSL